MIPADYINDVVGKKWVAGSSDPSIGLDCWGLIVDSYKRIDGIDLPKLNSYADLDIAEGYLEGLQKGAWHNCGEKEGAVIACFDKLGRLDHVARLFLGKALHARGKKNDAGEVCLWSLDHLRRLYKVEFYEWR